MKVKLNKNYHSPFLTTMSGKIFYAPTETSPATILDVSDIDYEISSLLRQKILVRVEEETTTKNVVERVQQIISDAAPKETLKEVKTKANDTAMKEVLKPKIEIKTPVVEPVTTPAVEAEVVVSK